MELPKGPYNPTETEARILKYWLENKFYKPEYDPRTRSVHTTEEMKQDDRKPYCLICPPPNAYAKPHLGNLSGYAYQDVMGRFHRMRGKKVLLFPGKDHAAQEAETIYIRDVLGPQGKSKHDFTREEFYALAYKHFTDMLPQLQQEEKNIGLSADYDRDLFTLDPRVHSTIMSTFLKMHADNMVYKDVRIINWSPGMQSAVADIDTERKEREADLIYIKYPLADQPGEFISVATTRPETMLGDTAVVVDPTDKRYKGLIGKTVILPLVDREIPIIANGRVDKEFGTGAVKLTPAHAQEDYVMMLEWNYRKDFERMPANVVKARDEIGEVGYINVIWKDSRMVGPIGKYAGMSTDECRQAVIADLQELGLITKTEKITQNIVLCERTKTVIEPMMSSQWFIDVDRLKTPALEALRDGKVTVHPENMQRKMEHWLENLRDWPISRSIWWGYRIPVWYKGEISEFVDTNGQVQLKIGDKPIASFKQAVESGLAKVQLEAPGADWIQDPDVFDTWFSSGQWPIATLTAEDLMDTFYPTQDMVMGYGILELWASRMIMLGLYNTGEVPFSDVYIHGHINAPDGRKMSKSLKNVVYADEITQEAGFDTLRLFYLAGNKAGENYRVDYEKIEGNKRFLNKLWNASKFVLMNVQDADPVSADILKMKDLQQESNRRLYQHITEMHQEVTKLIETYNFGVAAQNLVNEFWHTFCDQCIEEAKPHMYVQKDKETGEIITEPDPQEKQETELVLLFALKSYLKMLHPFIPFITEELWQFATKAETESDTIMYAAW